MVNTKKTIALTLWWCEGTKLRRDKRWKNAYLYPIEITNTDPKIIKIFTDFLREDLKVSESRLRGQIQVHEGDNLKKIENFWSSYLGLPKQQFNKTIIRPKGNRFRNNNGTFKLRTYDKKLYLKLQALLENELKIFSTNVSESGAIG